MSEQKWATASIDDGAPWCDDCKHICDQTYFTEGHASCCHWERCSHCGTLVENYRQEKHGAILGGSE